jgi:hypothetical protein
MPGPDKTPGTHGLDDLRNVALLIGIPLIVVLAIAAAYFYVN